MSYRWAPLKRDLISQSSSYNLSSVPQVPTCIPLQNQVSCSGYYLNGKIPVDTGDLQVCFPGSLTDACFAGSLLRKILHECTSQ